MLDLNRELYRKLLLVRGSEEMIREHYLEDDMKTPMHMSMGEEAIVVGVCQALGTKDQVFCSYRSHGAYLARTEDVDGFFAELYAKETSRVRGRGGSMHLCNPELGFMGSSAIVASQIPVAVGAAHANKLLENGGRVAVFFGEGAVDEGVFWESLNAACLMELPVLFVCEDNGLAVHTPTGARRGYDALTSLVERYRCHVFASDATEAQTVHDLTAEALARMGRDGRPAFLELKYYRYLEHVGINYDFEAGYRPKADFEPWLQRDPLTLQRAKLLALGLGETALAELERGVREEIATSVRKAQQAPLSALENPAREIFS